MLGDIELAEHSDLATATSPAHLVTAEAHVPPTLIMHGGADELLPFEQSATLYERLRAAGKDVEFYRMEGMGHGEGSFDNAAVLDIVEGFLRSHMA